MYKQVMRFLSEMNVWQNGERKEFYPALTFWFDWINIQGFVGIPLKFHTIFLILNLHTYIWSIYVDLLVFWSADYRVLNTDSPFDQQARAKRIMYLSVIDSLSSVMLEACNMGDDQRVSVEPIMLADLSM